MTRTATSEPVLTAEVPGTPGEDPVMLNGWDVKAMQEAVEGVRAQPEAGRLTWRGRVRWDGGFGMDARAEGIEQLGQVMPRHFTMRGDHPPELLGQNTGPTAVETLLGALGSCVAGTYAAQATGRGVRLDGLEVEVEGAIDLNGFFGLQPVSPGLSDVRVSIRVDSDADDGTIEELRRAALAASPVYDSVTRAVGVDSIVSRR